MALHTYHIHCKAHMQTCIWLSLCGMQGVLDPETVEADLQNELPPPEQDMLQDVLLVSAATADVRPAVTTQGGKSAAMVMVVTAL